MLYDTQHAINSYIRNVILYKYPPPQNTKNFSSYDDMDLHLWSYICEQQGQIQKTVLFYINLVAHRYMISIQQVHLSIKLPGQWQAQQVVVIQSCVASNKHMCQGSLLNKPTKSRTLPQDNAYFLRFWYVSYSNLCRPDVRPSFRSQWCGLLLV